jgi:chromosome segregation ATPase
MIKDIQELELQRFKIEALEEELEKSEQELIAFLEKKGDELEQVKQEEKEVKELLDSIELRRNEIEEEILLSLKAANKDNIKTDTYTIYLETKRYYSLPKIEIDGGEEREKFISYLKKIGAYDRVSSVNSTSLNSFWKSELEAIELTGKQPDFNLPFYDSEKVKMRKKTNKNK